VRKAVIEASRVAGGPELSPHALRRTFDGLLRKANVDSFVRRGLAGWRTEGAQAIYTQVDRDDRAAAGRAFIQLVNGAPAAEDSRGTPAWDTSKNWGHPEPENENGRSLNRPSALRVLRAGDEI